jgi:hypothetical protein
MGLFADARDAGRSGCSMASALRSAALKTLAPIRNSAVGKMAETELCAMPGRLKKGQADWGAHLKALDEAGLIKKTPAEFAKLKEMVSASRKHACVPSRPAVCPRRLSREMDRFRERERSWFRAIGGHVGMQLESV